MLTDLIQNGITFDTIYSTSDTLVFHSLNSILYTNLHIYLRSHHNISFKYSSVLPILLLLINEDNPFFPSFLLACFYFLLFNNLKRFFVFNCSKSFIFIFALIESMPDRFCIIYTIRFPSYFSFYTLVLSINTDFLY